jgi:transposase
MKPITEQASNDIISLLRQGFSTRQIAKTVGVSCGTVSNVRQKELSGVEASKGGRPYLLSARQKRLIVRKITSGECDTATQVQRTLLTEESIKVSAQTVRNALQDAGMRGMVKQKKPLFKPRHIKARLEFARKYKDWTIDDWKRVVWSDETKINRFGSDGREWCWRKRGERLQARHVQPTVKFGGGSLMIWACFTTHGIGDMCQIEGGMDAKLYAEILEDYVFPTVDHYSMDRERFIFQQDNDPKHTSRLAREWFNEHQVRLLDWPAQSPDLNPIEHLWDHLKRRLSRYEQVPTSMDELWQRVQTEWTNIPVEECVKLIESMPRRVAAVLEAKGGYTKY